MSSTLSLESYGIVSPEIVRNLPPVKLYREALAREGHVTGLSDSGALIALSGEKTGRSPKDKRVVREPSSEKNVWWGPINIPLETESFVNARGRAVDYLNSRDRLFVVDGFAGWDLKYRLKVRIVCARAYHALFMHNMLIRPTDDELANFGEPDFTVFNAGQFPAAAQVKGIGSRTCVAVSFDERELIILGTEYAGEMKKGVFTIMNYLMPKRGVVSMHCSANEDPETHDTSIFFGLSGTGKTTLSADPRRLLIGDDEHCWSDEGVFNIEGGCYAKCIDLSAELEPEIFSAIRFGSVLENVVYSDKGEVDFTDSSITENTRCSYPIEYIPNAKIPCVGSHPTHVILLTCDAFGVLPPVAELSPEQAMYHFISGYTAKVAGTEMGVTEPQATFSACFGAAFMVWHPTNYAELLAEKIRAHGSRVWLVNTGWSGGLYGVGSRIKLPYTRAIVDAIHSGELNRAEKREDALFGFQVPTSCSHVPSQILDPKSTWADQAAYDAKAQHLAKLFANNFRTYTDQASAELLAAGPRV